MQSFIPKRRFKSCARTCALVTENLIPNKVSWKLSLASHCFLKILGVKSAIYKTSFINWMKNCLKRNFELF